MHRCVGRAGVGALRRGKCTWRGLENAGLDVVFLSDSGTEVLKVETEGAWYLYR